MNSQKILINTSEWYANSTDKTLGAMVQYIASVLDSKIGGCEYVVINNYYPAVKLPWSDGNLSDFTYPVMYFDGAFSTDSKNSVSIKIGISDGVTFLGKDIGYWQIGVGSSVSESHGKIYLSTTNIGITINADYVKDYEFYSFGWISIPVNISEDNYMNDYYLGTPIIIGKLISLIDKSKVDAVIYSPCFNQTKIDIYTYTTSTVLKIQHTYSQDSMVVVVDDFNCGRYYHPKLKIVHPYAHTMIGNNALWSLQGRYSPYGWRKSVILIDGEYYDILPNTVYPPDITLIIPSITE